MKKIMLFLGLMFVASVANASVYTTSGVGWDGRYYEAAWSTNGACQYDYRNQCNWISNPRIGIKASTGPDANKWVVLPQWYGQPQGLRDDINEGVRVITLYGLAWRWGACYPSTTYWNMLNCFY